MEGANTHFFIYGRKSVYTGKGESIENQIEMCRQYIYQKFSDSNAPDITIYEDSGFSAKNTDRPQFQQMLRDIRKVKPDFVICYRLDRISRNVSDFSALIEELNDRNISFVCIKEEFDTSKPMGKAMMYIASVFAQLERETIAERVRDNMMMLARTGRWLGGTTPTGYLSEKQQEIIIDGKIKTSCKLKDNPDELHAVDIIFQKFLELCSISGVSKYLIRQGIHSRTGKWFSLLGIKEILQNPVYCIADRDAFYYFTEKGSDVCFEEQDCSEEYGLLSYNKRDYRKKNAPRHPVNQWIIALGKHRGRIAGEKWVAAQNIIQNNIPSGDRPAKTHNDYALLSGLITCGKCNSRLFSKHRCRQPEQFDYICASKLQGGLNLCDCQNMNGNQTDHIVCEQLMLHINENPDIFILLKKLKQKIIKEEKHFPSNTVQSQIKKCDEEIKRLLATISENSLSPEFIRKINERVTLLDHRLTVLKQEDQQIQDMRQSNHDDLLYEPQIKALSDFRILFHSLSVAEKRVFIKLLICKIIWDGENLHIYLNDE